MSEDLGGNQRVCRNQSNALERLNSVTLTMSQINSSVEEHHPAEILRLVGTLLAVDKHIFPAFPNRRYHQLLALERKGELLITRS